ncbi:MAG: hypothetical protein ACPG5T_02390, partial [Endozoicomonas sp.]
RTLKAKDAPFMASGQTPQDSHCQERGETGNPREPGNNLQEGLPERTEDRKLKSQLNAALVQDSDSESKEKTEKNTWEQEVSAIEQSLLSALSQLESNSVEERTELRKRVAELHKIAHDLMTQYNQRINSLLMEDRLSHRHASETSAHMFRGVMPPLEALRLLEKFLISTRKKTPEESIEKLTADARSELGKACQLLQETKQKLVKHTLPPRPDSAKSRISPLNRMLEQEPRPQKKTAEKAMDDPCDHPPVKPTFKVDKEPSASANKAPLAEANKKPSHAVSKNQPFQINKELATKTSTQSNNQSVSSDTAEQAPPKPLPEKATSRPVQQTPKSAQPSGSDSSDWLSELKTQKLKSLAKPLKNLARIEDRNERQAALAALNDFIHSQQQLYKPLAPLFSMACRKCELLEMKQDKACKNGLEGLTALAEIQPLLSEKMSEAMAEETPTQPLINALKKADTALNNLSSFDKKLTGEARQLLTELVPVTTTPYHHLLNLAARKLLLEGPVSLSLKTSLRHFEALDQYLLATLTDTETIDHNHHFLSFFSEKFSVKQSQHLFSSPTQLKKVIAPINKLEEVHALAHLFAHWEERQDALLSRVLQKLVNLSEGLPESRGIDNIQPVIEKGLQAHDCLISSFPQEVLALIHEKKPDQSNFTERFKEQLMEYFELYEQAVKSASRHDDQISHFASVQAESARLASRFADIIESIEASASVSHASLSLSREIRQWVDQEQPLNTLATPLHNCQSFLIKGVRTEQIEAQKAIEALTTLLQLQQFIDNPDAALSAEAAPQSRLTPTSAIEEAFEALNNKHWPKWCSQLFHRSRVEVMVTLQCLTNVCQQSPIAYKEAAALLQSVSRELSSHNDDPLIQHLLKAVEDYALQIVN